MRYKGTVVVNKVMQSLQNAGERRAKGLARVDQVHTGSNDVLRTETDSMDMEAIQLKAADSCVPIQTYEHQYLAQHRLRYIRIKGLLDGTCVAVRQA